MVKQTSFEFTGYDSKIESGEVRFQYVVTRQNVRTIFTEKLFFDPPSVPISPELQRYQKRVLDNVYLMLGVTYWKLYCPKDIKITNIQLSQEQATFWNTVYTKGLGEFFYKNSLDYRGLVEFPYTTTQSVRAVEHVHLKDRSLVLLGGGKDSIVSADLLGNARYDFSFFSVNAHPARTRIAQKAGVSLITIERRIDEKFFSFSNARDAYNGHIPASALFAFLSLFAAGLYDYRYVIVSNEMSANEGNIEYLGTTINHQWSKSYEFELLFREYVSIHIGTGIEYFSLLRPMSEIKIVQLFSRNTQYFDTFTSCNSTFRIHNPGTKRWCGKCPKCAFIFLLLAAYLPKNRVIDLFGENLLDNMNLLDMYKRLLGLTGFKPFECVGTSQEALFSWAIIVDKGDFSASAIIRSLSQELETKLQSIRNTGTYLLQLSTVHSIPEEFQKLLKNV